MSEVDDNYKGEIRNRINTFETQYYQLSRNADMFGRYNTWVHFECNEGSNKLVIDTAKPENTRIILQTWEYNKNGSGKANSFTLRICYDFANSAELYKWEDIHYVERALCLNAITENSGGFISGFHDNSRKLRCKFQYGYLNVGTSGTQVLSPKYEGMITSCVPELRDNMLFYTIKGVSGTFGGHDSKKFHFPAASNIKATDLAWKILNDYYGDGYADEKNKDGQIGFANTLTEPYQIINKTSTNSTIYSKEKNIEMGTVNSATVFEYVNDVLRNANLSDIITDEELKEIAPDKRPHYVFYVDDIPDSSGKKRIVIDFIDPANSVGNAIEKHISNREEGWEDMEVPQSDAGSYDTGITFTYPSKNQNFILSFLPSVDLNVIWTGTVVSNSQATRWGIDDGGILLQTSSVDGEGFTTVTRVADPNSPDKPKEVISGSNIPSTSSGVDETGAESSAKSSVIRTEEGEMSIASFARATDIAFKASMSCVGLPCDIPIGTRIRIRPILNGADYWFSGSYYILSCSDRIDSSGYITDMELFRLPKSRS